MDIPCHNNNGIKTLFYDIRIYNFKNKFNVCNTGFY